MAKTGAAAAEEPQISMDELYAGFSAEELAEFFGTTGQAANLQERTPILKVNYCDIADKTGREIKKGNFVLSQNSSEVQVEVDDGAGGKTTELRVEDIGIDLGKNPLITVLFYGFRYSYYHADKKKMCSSQIIFDRWKEKPVGSNLKFECSAKPPACPRRQKEVERTEKCPCQWVIFCEVPLEDGTRVKAVLYAKGNSYMPFQEYLDSTKIPLFFAPTKLTTKMEREGSVTYYVLGFEFMKNRPHPQVEARAHAATAKAAKEGAEAYKQQQLQGAARSQIAHSGEGKNARLLKEDNVDDICFD